MTVPFDRPRRDRSDDDFDRLLGRGVPASLTDDGPHVDPEQLAAWADDGLPAASRADVEAHLAACASCQTLAAVFARSAPDAGASAVAAASGEAAAEAATHGPARVLPWTPLRVAKWLAPVAAAAAAVMIWMVRPDDGLSSVRLSEPVGQQARQEAAPSPAPALPGSASAGNLAGESPGPRGAGTPAAGRAPATERQASPEAASNKAAAPVEPPAPVFAPAAPIAAPTVAPPTILPAPPPRSFATPPPPAATPPAATAARAAQSADAGANAAGLLRDAANDASRPTFEVVTRLAAAESTVPILPATPPPPAGAGRGGGGARAIGAAGQAGMRAEQATVPVRWRVVGGRQIERSQDNGATWLPVAVNVPAPLLAGASPTPLVCWLVGERGVVLLSTDGAQFTQVTAPADATLSSVTASSRSDAIVVTADGRRFVTTDAGQTWRPLQEILRPPF